MVARWRGQCFQDFSSVSTSSSSSSTPASRASSSISWNNHQTHQGHQTQTAGSRAFSQVPCIAEEKYMLKQWRYFSAQFYKWSMFCGNEPAFQVKPNRLSINDGHIHSAVILWFKQVDGSPTSGSSVSVDVLLVERVRLLTLGTYHNIFNEPPLNLLPCRMPWACKTLTSIYGNIILI